MTLRTSPVSLPISTTVVPFFFECYTSICERLQIKAHTYYSEHVGTLTVFHAIEGQRLLKAMDVTGDLDPGQGLERYLYGT